MKYIISAKPAVIFTAYLVAKYAIGDNKINEYVKYDNFFIPFLLCHIATKIHIIGKITMNIKVP